MDVFFIKLVKNIRKSARYNQLTKSRLCQMSLKCTINQCVLPTLYKNINNKIKKEHQPQ